MNEVLIPCPTDLKPVTAVRGTVIVSSLASLRMHDRYERYRELLDPSVREELCHCVAASWVSMDLALQHYDACERLRLEPAEMIEMGEYVGQKIQGTFMATLTRAFRAAGATPWSLLGQIDRLWARLMFGGGVAIRAVGPKDAVMDWLGSPLYRFRHYCYGFCGVMNVGFRLVGTRVFFVRIERVSADGSTATYRASWV
jgi:hypothetical protein